MLNPDIYIRRVNQLDLRAWFAEKMCNAEKAEKVSKQAMHIISYIRKQGYCVGSKGRSQWFVF